MYRRLGGPQDQSGRVRKFSSSPGFDPRTVHHVASRYTDWVIPAHTDRTNRNIRHIILNSIASHRTDRLSANPIKVSGKATFSVRKTMCFLCLSGALVYQYKIFHGPYEIIGKISRHLLSERVLIVPKIQPFVANIRNYICGHVFQHFIITTHHCIVFYHFNNP
jgi:hypothetical protein